MHYKVRQHIPTVLTVSVTRKNRQMSKKLPKNDFTRKMIDFGHLYKKLPKTVGDLGKLIVSKGFKNLPKVQ